MSIKFDASSSYSASSAISTDTTTLTMMCWAYIVDTEGGCLLSIGSTSSTEGGYAVGHGSNTMDGDGETHCIGLLGGVEWHDTNSSIGTGWHHITQLRDGGSSWRYYVDGSSTGFGDTTGPGAIQSQTCIGAQFASAGRGTKSRICQFKMWSSLLTDAQILNEMRSTQPIHNFSTLVAYLPMEQYDTPPSTLIDTQGKVSFSKNGTPAGANHTHF